MELVSLQGAVGYTECAQPPKVFTKVRFPFLMYLFVETKTCAHQP